MDKLVNGYLRFRDQIFPGKKGLFEQLAGEQHPRALFITCSDSRVLPDLITQADPGDLFICRNAGNIVPTYGERNGGVSATIEYAVLALNVEDIIVCGHSDCGAMHAVMHPHKLKGMTTVENWLFHAETARRIVDENYPEMTDADKLRALTHENVMAQIDHLKTHPSVAARLARGKIQLHGWVYEIHTGDVDVFDGEAGRFVRLTEGEIPTATPQPRRMLTRIA